MLNIGIKHQGHQRLAPVAEDQTGLLAGGMEDQHLASGSGCIILLDPVAAVRDRQIVPAEAVLPVPGKRAGTSQDLIPPILRECKVHIQPEIARIIAAAAIDVYADIRVAAVKAFHVQSVAEIPVRAEFQELPLRLQAVLLCQLPGLGIHNIAVGFPIVLRQRAVFSPFLPVGGVFLLESVEVRAGLVGVGSLQPRQGQSGGIHRMGILHVYSVHQGIVPLLRPRADFDFFQIQHIGHRAAHQQKRRADQRRRQQRPPDGAAGFPVLSRVRGKPSEFRVLHKIVTNILQSKKHVFPVHT